MKRLIVNADDFGWSEAVTSGILRAHREGVVTSTTLMTNLAGAEEALRRARREAPNLAVGIHLNLTEDRPLAPAGEVAAVLDDEGCFIRSLPALYRRLRFSAAARDAAAKELQTQIQWTRDHGLVPSHLDSHKHVHEIPSLLGRVIALARQYGIRAIRSTVELQPSDLGPFAPSEWGMIGQARQFVLKKIARRWGRQARRAIRRSGLATTDWLFGVWATGGISADLVVHLLRHAPEGTGELMVHPGLADASPPRASRLDASRPRELEALCDGRVRRAAAELGWTWATYKDLVYDYQPA